MREKIAKVVSVLENLKYLEPAYNIIKGWENIIIKPPEEATETLDSRGYLAYLMKNRTFKKGAIQGAVGHAQIILYPFLATLIGASMGAGAEDLKQAYDAITFLYGVDLLARIGPDALKALNAYREHMGTRRGFENETL